MTDEEISSGTVRPQGTEKFPMSDLVSALGGAQNTIDVHGVDTEVAAVFLTELQRRMDRPMVIGTEKHQVLQGVRAAPAQPLDVVPFAEHLPVTGGRVPLADLTAPAVPVAEISDQGAVACDRRATWGGGKRTGMGKHRASTQG